MPTFECKPCQVEVDVETTSSKELYCSECGKGMTRKQEARTGSLQAPPGRVGGTMLDMSIPEDVKKPAKGKDKK